MAGDCHDLTLRASCRSHPLRSRCPQSVRNNSLKTGRANLLAHLVAKMVNLPRLAVCPGQDHLSIMTWHLIQQLPALFMQWDPYARVGLKLHNINPFPVII
ncbi:hypothetical protein H845_1836 [Komagataeibacter xylinus E25]|nr:hypothetical protein H845_1836 [Komagataeibacter xylinus E25]